MRVYRHTSGVWSVAFAPDGTLYALPTDRQLLAFPADGRGRVLVARDNDRRPLEGRLHVSPDGRWLSVGLYFPVLFRVGSVEPAPAGDSLPPGWRDHVFPAFHFFAERCFTADSAVWVCRTKERPHGPRHRVTCWPLPGLEPFVHPALSSVEFHQLAPVPGTRDVVVEGYSAEHDASTYWRADPGAPDEPLGDPVGTTDDCNGLAIGGDGRFHVSLHGKVEVYRPDGRRLRRALTLEFPLFADVVPHVALSADGRRLVARGFRKKVVYGADTVTGTVLGPWDWKIGEVCGVAVAPDGLTAAAAGSNKKLVVWDLDG